MVPSILTEELTHHELKVQQVTAGLERGDSTSTYTLDYPEISRKLLITFENAFPYRIMGWEETFQTVAGWGMESKVMTTRARRIDWTRSDYWEKKYLKHEPMRANELGIQD